MENGGRPITECLELQLAEIEMLGSMYPKRDEFCVTVPSLVADVNAYIDGKTKLLPNHLDYTLQLTIPDLEDRLEINVNLPHKYPDVEPKIYVRAEGLSREEQKELNCAVSESLSSQPLGELYMCQLIAWLTENAHSYFSSRNAQKQKNTGLKKVQNKKFTRMWMYSHHIFSKDKRRAILKLGEDLGLNGFCLPGKPGIICVEGYSEDCEDFYQRIRQMSWKKLSLVKEETYELNSLNPSDLKKLEPFKEISFEVRRGPAREYHMDMGGFYKYLDDHGCGYVFQDIFGFEGHSTTECI